MQKKGLCCPQTASSGALSTFLFLLGVSLPEQHLSPILLFPVIFAC
jgi:hypothetical protein